MGPQEHAGDHQACGHHAGGHYERLYSEWLTALRDWDAERVGFGWVVLRKESRGRVPWIVSEDQSEALRLPTGAEVLQQLDAFAAQDAASAPALLAGEPHWDEAALVEVQQVAGTGTPVGMSAWRQDGWRAPVAIDARVAAVLADTGPLQDRLDRLEAEPGAEGEDEDALDVLAVVLVTLRRLIGAGLVRLD